MAKWEKGKKKQHSRHPSLGQVSTLPSLCLSHWDMPVICGMPNYISFQRWPNCTILSDYKHLPILRQELAVWLKLWWCTFDLMSSLVSYSNLNAKVQARFANNMYKNKKACNTLTGEIIQLRQSYLMNKILFMAESQ